ncbi:MAG: sensor histidine kinase [Actinomycetota bacterium]
MRRRRSRGPGAPTAPVRLGRLRLRLTLFFTGAFAIGIAVMAVLVVAGDERFGRSRLDADLRERARDGVRRVRFDAAGQLDLADLVADVELVEGYPQVYVVEYVPADPARDETEKEAAVALRPQQQFAPRGDYASVARTAVSAGGDATADDRADGYRLRMLASPFADNDGVFRGAVVAVADDGPRIASHRRLTTLVWVGSSGLLVAAALAGYVLAGRSTRPVGEALDQQERFLADAAHELRTPVAALRGVTESGLAGDEPPRRALERTAGIVDDAGEVLEDLLTLARMDARREPVELEPVRLDLLVEELIATRADAPPVELRAEECVVRADPQLVRRAVGNLVENAVRHGRVDDATAEIVVTVDDASVAVADRGPGIEEELLGQLFERFRTGRRSGGSGLGLAIVEWVARAHRGRIEAANRDDGGAVFTLTLGG